MGLTTPIWKIFLALTQSDKDNNMATESTEEHGKIAFKAFIFPCSSVGFVAIK
jgi:hypothetical protein